jgi:hypothetical protein
MKSPCADGRDVRRLETGTCGPVFLRLLSHFGKLLEIIKYLTCHSFYQLVKSQDLPNSYCQTVGDALIYYNTLSCVLECHKATMFGCLQSSSNYTHVM